MQKHQKSTWLTKEAAHEQRDWHIVDLDGQVLGRAASKIASVLRGKHKPTYTPNVDAGDFVVVVNASKVRLTGTKPQKKLYRFHTLYPGGMRPIPAQELQATRPETLIREAVWGMLPKGPLGRRLMRKLKIYAGPTHEHAAQSPRPLQVS